MRKGFDFDQAEDIKSMLRDIVDKLEMAHVQVDHVHCVRSSGSTARAYARIWGLSRIFQFAAGFKATYVIEVLSEHFDKLSEEKKVKVLIHELLHIPKTFSGALLSHKGRYHRVNDRVVETYYKKLVQ